jgi:hypothetical protein
MAKKVLFLMVLAVIAAGSMFAGEAGLSFESIGYDTSLAVPVLFPAEFDGGFELAPLAEGSSASSSGGILTGSKFVAGVLNLPLGLWSWLNKDWWGGGMTAGLEGGGFTLLLVGAFVKESVAMVFIGLGVFIGGAVYGFKRGWAECGKIQQAGSLAEALGENPLKHISLAAAPNGEGGMAGALTWRAAW